MAGGTHHRARGWARLGRVRPGLDAVIGARHAGSFLLEKQLELHEIVRSLFDFRLIHLVRRGYADKDNPGLRYNIYTLDYGTYVDLLGTKTAPVDDFTETLEGENGEVIVPLDDRRSIRRIILRREHLEIDIPATSESDPASD